MSQLLISAIVSFCLTTPDSKECVIYFGNCVADYKKEDEAYKKCQEKWKKQNKSN